MDYPAEICSRVELLPGESSAEGHFLLAGVLVIYLVNWMGSEFEVPRFIGLGVKLLVKC